LQTTLEVRYIFLVDSKASETTVMVYVIYLFPTLEEILDKFYL